MRVHKDERRNGYFDIFPEIGKGDINVSVIKPRQSAGDWHAHKNQGDYWFIAKGTLLVGLKDPLDVDYPCVYLECKEGTFVNIPRRVWHTYKNETKEDVVLIYHITNKFDEENPDEFRLKFNKEEKKVLG